MKKYFRIFIAIALMAGITVLARNKVVWAGGFASQTIQADLAQLAGFVWNDADRDGLQDVEESGLPNVTVDLYDGSGTLVNSVITDANGRYVFADLAPGDYYVDFLPPSGYVFSPRDNSENDALDSDADIVTGETILTTLVAGENTMKWDAGLYRPVAQLLARPEPGTVKPPPAELTVCENGDFTVGGVSILKVTELEPGYCLAAFLRNNAFALGRIPDGAGSVLAHITFLRVFLHGELVQAVPADDGIVQICYAVPPGKEAQIYFFDFYGPRFGTRTGQPTWEALPTTIEDGIACAPAQKTGAYALIGK